VTTVTDADREAAAEYGRAVGIFTRLEARNVRNGGNDDCTIVQAFARHREAAEQRGRLEGAEIMREAAAERLRSSVLYSVKESRISFMTARDIIKALDPAAILAAHARAKETPDVRTDMADLGASGDLGLGRDGLVLKPLGDSDGDDGA
jgi:hypothetical protein